MSEFQPAAASPTVFVVDGYNLALGSLAFSMACDRGGLRALRDAVFEAVARDCERRSEGAVIVWDGTDRVGLEGRRDPRGVRESFSRAPEKADERVIAVAMQLRDGGGVPVIVSDDRRHVRADAERAGLRWMACARYEERLSSPLPVDPFAETEGRHARRALTRLVVAGFVDDPGTQGDELVAELAAALAYAISGSARPHKMARAVVRWLREYGVEVRGGPHEHRALLAPLWEDPDRL
jgi:predicted RNA-binding protein with PIN domain